MSATSTRSSGHDAQREDTVLILIGVGLLAATLATVTAAVRLGGHFDHVEQEVPGNPIALVVGLAKGTVRWPHTATVVAAAIAAVLVLSAVVAAVLIGRRAARSTRVDRASRQMGRGRDLASLRQRAATSSAHRMGVASPGLPIARTVAGGQLLYASWEDVSIDIWGPRTGKSTARAIPAILEAPGAVLATSNKRDLVDATRDLRAEVGEVWVFDPQALVDEPPTWWWNPLSYVTDEVKASILADVFASSSREPGARTDAYFEPAGQDLLAQLLLAAALADRPLTQVYLWLADPRDDEPVDILRAHDYPLLARALQAVVNAPEKQRAGIYGTAQQMASFLTNRQAARWVTDDPTAAVSSSPANPWLAGNPPSPRRQFDPRAFVQSTGTLYSLSKEGRGSAGPLVTALTVALTEAAEEHAKRSPGGRLPVPMVCVLDEAANVCRWRELPNLYSHYGSRGICILTILQSWSQGVEVWGRDGMRKLWSAANVKVYGGGVSEVEFLSELSQLIGDFDLKTISTSHGKGGRSTSRATRRERVLDVADLAALPRGRAIVFASGAPATLVRTLPWMSGPHADRVRASIQAHDPAAEQTLRTAPFDESSPAEGVANIGV